jgi:hypothetical protein
MPAPAASAKTRNTAPPIRHPYRDTLRARGKRALAEGLRAGSGGAEHQQAKRAARRSRAETSTGGFAAGRKLG